MARPSQSPSPPPRIILVLAILALSIPALVAASSPVQQHAHQLQQRQQHHRGHANGALAHQRRDLPYNDNNVDYHRMRLMPRQSNAAGGSDGGSSDDDSGAGSPLSSGRVAITPSNTGANGNGGGSNGQASNTANPPVASNTNPVNTPSASNAGGSAAASQTTPGGLLGNIGSGISSALNDGASSSSTDTVVVAPSSTSETLPPTTSDTTSANTQTTVDPNLAASSSSTDVIDNITLTQTVSASEAASDTSVPEETAASTEKKEESSGVSKSAVIIIIVVASCVGGAIAIWTIIRKIKLSPSSRFNRKLSPIDFSANRRDSTYFDTLGSVDNLAKTANGGGSPPNGMISDKDDINSWALNHSPSQSSNGHQHHDRQDSNEKIGGGIYGSIAPALPPSSSVSGSIRRNPTMTSSHSNGALGMEMGMGGLNRADSLASSANGGVSRSDSGHLQQQQQYQGFYPAMPPPSQVVGQNYNNPTYHQGYAPQYQHNNGLDYSQSMRRPGGYDY